jgi:hypothetical protein
MKIYLSRASGQAIFLALLCSIFTYSSCLLFIPLKFVTQVGVGEFGIFTIEEQEGK